MFNRNRHLGKSFWIYTFVSLFFFIATAMVWAMLWGRFWFSLHEENLLSHMDDSSHITDSLPHGQQLNKPRENFTSNEHPHRDTITQVGTPAGRLPVKLRKLMQTPLGQLLTQPTEVSAEEIAKDKRRLSWIPIATKLARGLMKCIQSEECKELPQEDHPYYDPENTSLHRALAKTLHFLRAVGDSPTLITHTQPAISRHWPTESELLKWIETPHPEIQLASLALLAQENLPEQSIESIYSKAVHFRGPAKIMYFQQLESILDHSQHSETMSREKFIKVFRDSLKKEEDIATIVAITKGFDQLKPLAPEEFRQTISALCHIRNDPEISHNWEAISLNLSKYAERNEIPSITPDDICPSHQSANFR